MDYRKKKYEERAWAGPTEGKIMEGFEVENGKTREDRDRKSVV